jgi:hypothetical protein
MPDGGLPDRAGATIERVIDALGVSAGGDVEFLLVLAVLVRLFS